MAAALTLAEPGALRLPGLQKGSEKLRLLLFAANVDATFGRMGLRCKKQADLVGPHSKG
jgi:hypothetical protein